MKYIVKLIFILTLCTFCSCSEKLPYGDPLETPKDILKNSSSFINYWITAMDLSTDFVGFDPFSKPVSKETF